MSGIRYTDGDAIEARILELVREASDRRAHVPIALEHYGDWPVQYHLAPERSNLLRPFRFEGLDVLELGAGMGAVSRLLAEQARRLTVVEGTEARYAVLEERLAGLTNWEGQVANLQDVAFDSQFDVVCVIGVLEYSALYLKPEGGRSPFETFLAIAGRFLKPEGVLVLAIENQLGLKYWSGSAEDHTARLFDGISGYPLGVSPRTFSRSALTALLAGAGFPHLDRYYPFPDYKIPTGILSEALIARNPDLAAEIACQQPFRNYGNPDVKFFDDTLALRTIARAGLLTELSNSFLWIASRTESSPVRARLLGPQLTDRAIGWYYASQRRIPTETVFRDAGAAVVVDKRAFGPAAVETAELVDADLGRVRWAESIGRPIAPGLALREILARAAYFEDWPRINALLRAFLRWSFDLWGEGESLSGRALDAIFVNATVTEFRPGSAGEEPSGVFHVFDEEWTLGSAMPRSWFVFRNVYNLLRDGKLLTASSGFGSFTGLYERLCRDLGVAADLESDLDREARLQALTGSQPRVAVHRGRLEVIFRRPLPASAWPRSAAAETALRAESGRRGSLPRRVMGKARRAARRLRDKARSLPRSRRIRLRPLRGGFELPRGLVAIPSSGLVAIECRGDFSRASRADLAIGFRAENGTSATMRLRFPRLTKKRAIVLVRDPGSVDSLEVSFSPEGCVTGPPELRVRGLTRRKAAASLVGPLVRSFWSQPGSLLSFAAQGARLLRPSRRSHLKLWLKEELFRHSVPPADLYSCWIEKYDTLTESDRQAIRERVRALPEMPLFSIVMPTYNTDERWLRAAIDSVLGQLYPNWELCIADDCSPDPKVREVLEEYRRCDPRIRIAYRERNGHISAASNTALELASGEFIALLDHDDELTPDALYQVAEVLREHPDTDMIYSDEDKIDTQGRRYMPHFKPEWNPELFYSLNLVTHLAVFRTSIVRAIGGFRVGYEGSQDYDLTLRVLEQTTPARIRHIPHVLYHWRAIPGSVALASEEKTYAHEAARRAIRSHLERIGVSAEVREGFPPLHRVIYPLPDPLPKVTAIVPTRDRRDLLEGLLRGLLHGTDYPELEVIIVDNQSSDPATLEYFRELKTDPRVRILSYDRPFNFADLNNFAASRATSPFLLFLNNDLQVIRPDWLREMVRIGARPEVGAVGARLLYPDGRIQHAGVVLGIGGVGDHAHRFFPSSGAGYFGRAGVTMAYSAVTAACLLIRKAVFEEAGGFDAAHLAVAYNDIDLCLKIGERGYRVVWTPFAELYHLESASRGSDESAANRSRFQAERAWMQQRWGEKLRQDPAYNPNLSLAKIDFSLAFPPRVGKPWRRAAAEYPKTGKSEGIPVEYTQESRPADP